MISNDKMTRICFSSEGKTLDSQIDPRFGRCRYFLLVDVKNGEKVNFEVIENKGALQGSGAGISAAEQMSESNVDVLITGDVGPKAGNILNQLEIEVVKTRGFIEVELKKYLNNEEMTVIDNSSSSSVLTENKNTFIDDSQRVFIPLMNDADENSEISFHFGHAPYFGLYNVKSKELTIKENSLNHSDLSKSPVDQIIESTNPTIVFAQDMGARAIGLFAEKGVKLKTGSYKTVKEVISNLDNLLDLTNGCGH